MDVKKRDLRVIVTKCLFTEGYTDIKGEVINRELLVEECLEFGDELDVNIEILPE